MLQFYNVLAFLALMECVVITQAAQSQRPKRDLPVAQVGVAQQKDGIEWIKQPVAGVFPDHADHAIKETDIYEVVVSRIGVAVVHDLKDHSFEPLSLLSARWLTGHYFQCPDGNIPYLVRAVFGHGGTGKYIIKRSGRKLLVFHGSLGRTNAANKSALVVNLDFEPEEIFISTEIAQ